MTSLVGALGGRVVGTVEEVHADRISVLLEPDAPQATALNTGSPAGFPRINGYVLIPCEAGATVAMISSVRIERSPFPKQKGMQGFGLVDLPFPARAISVTPVGTLQQTGDAAKPRGAFKVRRGVDIFPSVGDPALLPTTDQLRAIVEGESGATAGRILIGRSPVAGGAPVHVDPNKLFGRHLAVLGNTGAGKSCSVAGLIRWSIEEARKTRESEKKEGNANARFLVLDPNGEYAEAFQDLDVRVFQVEPEGDARPLKVPAWMWNAEEWSAFSQAGYGVQRPTLLNALRHLRSGMGQPGSFETELRRCVRMYLDTLMVAKNSGDYVGGYGKLVNVERVLRNVEEEFQKLLGAAGVQGEAVTQALESVSNAARAALEDARPDLYLNVFDAGLFQAVIDAVEHAGETIDAPDQPQACEDAPIRFDVTQLPGVVDALAALYPGRDMAQFVQTLNLRIRSLMTRGALADVAIPEEPPTLIDWLKDHIGDDGASNGQIAVMDLSLVPSEVVHIVVAVLARMTLEALQRYRLRNGKELPTVLVLEEAHTFVHKHLAADSAPAAGRACCRIFERVAREGRKFGLGLVLASQRPSEVSQTVLSQCNTFLLHRIVNDKDQELVKKLVPDSLAAMLRELPSLPTRRAILLGWAAPAPVLVEVRGLAEEQQPTSQDPRFWEVWTGAEERSIDWGEIAGDWTSSVNETPQEENQT